jgi:hypothetical protein
MVLELGMLGCLNTKEGRLGSWGEAGRPQFDPSVIGWRASSTCTALYEHLWDQHARIV